MREILKPSRAGEAIIELMFAIGFRFERGEVCHDHKFLTPVMPADPWRLVNAQIRRI